MKNRKKMLTMLLAAMMLAGGVSGCSNQKQVSVESSLDKHSGDHTNYDKADDDRYDYGLEYEIFFTAYPGDIDTFDYTSSELNISSNGFTHSYKLADDCVETICYESQDMRTRDFSIVNFETLDMQINNIKYRAERLKAGEQGFNAEAMSALVLIGHEEDGVEIVDDVRLDFESYFTVGNDYHYKYDRFYAPDDELDVD